ncbi:MAG: SDR family NAD(P)-dependent oxidoreductase [Ramlibacter sp.]|jgi:meso-butanediol dehydrogenase/(S,S)-butanediol dehydrogenase/diacetyl reductase|uniref:SDR family NAD(P)-dependent oxidoreductase n=1 Tax=Ramlibacter sp. TaxID=1917967 RepID=UPI00260B0675|nr:SDR family oxidoreductase [Ramlibacter sp.]MDH4376015.1 SDR family NAD(P)-dependent oxidoreductase [Ramlibacter sp.]
MATEKIALVTGGSAGLGEDIALHLQREGYKVLVCGRRADKLDAMKARGVEAFQCDISSRDDIARMHQWVVQAYGGLDVLVNCAGIAVQRSPFVEASVEDIERLVQTNVLGTMFVTQAFLPLVIARKGSVVNFSSTLAQRPRAGSIAYSATKGAIEAFTRALAIEAAEHGVRVNCIAPALVRSEIYLAAGMSAADYEKLLAARAKEFPLRRVGEPEDVTGMLSYLVSDSAGWITGLCLPVDGGAMLR